MDENTATELDENTATELDFLRFRIELLTHEILELKTMLSNVVATVDGAIDSIKPLMEDPTSALIKIFAGGK